MKWLLHDMMAKWRCETLEQLWPREMSHRLRTEMQCPASGPSPENSKEAISIQLTLDYLSRKKEAAVPIKAQPLLHRFLPEVATGELF